MWHGLLMLVDLLLGLCSLCFLRRDIDGVFMEKVTI